jgi:CheY-like chemotaxis protein
MLDMQRAVSNQLNVEMTFVDLVRDILEPVASMLYRRGALFEVIVDCPFEHLVVESDPLRLKQIVLNLGRNAAKFVEQGFVRFRAAVVNDEVHLYVEDSGPGVPVDKRDNLFGRFQESLDSLNQGTGIGLALCKNLTELLGGSIQLDKNYHSGITDRPGACFVLNLRTPPIDEEEFHAEESEAFESRNSKQKQKTKDDGNTNDKPGLSPSTSGPSAQLIQNQELPSGLSVLFVDDDFTLRKLFVRAVGRATDGWKIDEASNGETAVSSVTFRFDCLSFHNAFACGLVLFLTLFMLIPQLVKVEENDYDIIFMDMYMASTNKQLLGTEATRELRAKGCKSIICTWRFQKNCLLI